MLNSLRRYHLGCGERLQALKPFVIEMNQLNGNGLEQLRCKTILKKKVKKGQH